MPDSPPSPPITATLSEDQKRRIAEALTKAGVRTICPMCGNAHFSVLDGYFANGLQTSFGGFILGGPSVPTAVIACNRCGFLSQHALGALGLLPKPESPK